MERPSRQRYTKSLQTISQGNDARHCSQENYEEEALEEVQTNGDFLVNLEASVNGNEIDVFRAGSAIVNAYITRENAIPSTILKFVKKYSKQTLIPKMPNQLDIVPGSLIMTHGYGLLAQLSVYANHAQNTQQPTTETDQFSKLTGSRLNVKGTYKFPDEAPFTGTVIDLKGLPASNQKAHIRLKNALCFVLRKSCIIPSEIKTTDWSFPGDKLSRHINPIPFPLELYEGLRDMFAEFFTISSEELDTSWIDDYGSLSCLSQYESLAEKKEGFRQLAVARKAFLVKIFPEEFRNAMSEIRHSTFDESTGLWSNRKRGSTRTALGRKQPVETMDYCDMEHEGKSSGIK